MRFQGSELDVLQVEPDVGSGPTVNGLSSLQSNPLLMDSIMSFPREHLPTMVRVSI